MTNEEFAALRTGDIVRGVSLGSGPFVVIANYGSRVTAVQTADLTNPSEWDLVLKSSHSDPLSLPELQVPGNAESQPPEPPSPEDLMEDEDAIEAVEQCDRILSGCEQIPEAGDDFAASVIEKVESMRETIVSRDHVTERQLIALQNMEDGVDRWIN